MQCLTPAADRSQKSTSKHIYSNFFPDPSRSICTSGKRGREKFSSQYVSCMSILDKSTTLISNMYLILSQKNVSWEIHRVLGEKTDFSAFKREFDHNTQENALFSTNPSERAHNLGSK